MSYTYSQQLLEKIKQISAIMGLKENNSRNFKADRAKRTIPGVLNIWSSVIVY